MPSTPIRRPGTYVAPAAEAIAAKMQAEEPEEEQPEQAAAKIEDDEEILTPIDRWRKGLETAKLTEEEADAIIDEMISRGFYEKEYTLFRGRLVVRFRSRDGQALERIARALDSVRTNDERVHSQIISRFNLASSLATYGDKKFTKPSTDEEFIERLKFVDSRPSAVLSQIYVALNNFDAQVFAALNEGAEMGFSQPRRG
jgi:hypothetical protein